MRRQANSLRLAAGEGSRRTVEREIAQADIAQKAQALGDLLEGLVSHRSQVRRESQGVEEPACRNHRQTADGRQRHAANGDGAWHWLQAFAGAVGTDGLGHEAFQPGEPGGIVHIPAHLLGDEALPILLTVNLNP